MKNSLKKFIYVIVSALTIAAGCIKVAGKYLVTHKSSFIPALWAAGKSFKSYDASKKNTINFQTSSEETTSPISSNFNKGKYRWNQQNFSNDAILKETQIVVIDIRTAEEFEKHPYDGANVINLDANKKSFYEDVHTQLKKSGFNTIIIYPTNDKRVASISKTLSTLGYNVLGKIEQ